MSIYEGLAEELEIEEHTVFAIPLSSFFEQLIMWETSVRYAVSPLTSPRPSTTIALTRLMWRGLVHSLRVRSSRVINISMFQ